MNNQQQQQQNNPFYSHQQQSFQSTSTQYSNSQSINGNNQLSQQYSQQQSEQQYQQFQQQQQHGQTTVVTSQMYYSADSRRLQQQQQQQHQQVLFPQSTFNPYQQQQPQLPMYQQPLKSPLIDEFDPLSNTNSNSVALYGPPKHSSFGSLAQSDMYNSRPGSSSSLSNSSSHNSLNNYSSNPSRTTILSHADGSLMLQEIFIVSGTLDERTGYAHSLDLQGIWARVRNNQGVSDMRLALRMVNSSSSIVITDIQLSFSPNSFGLLSDPSINLLSSVGGALNPGQSATCNLTLFCSPENQKITPDTDLSLATINITYNLSNRSLNVSHQTFIPLHIFFADHPQADPTNYVSDPSNLSCTDDGPRLTQSAFLSTWPAPNLPSHFFAFESINWKRWYASYSQAGVLSAITGVTFPTSNPTTREVLKVFERKLSTNRIYVVASREIHLNSQANGGLNSAGLPDLVFFCSFKVGEMSGPGVLILSEIKFSGDDWGRCEVKMRSTVNKRLWGGLERAVRAILLS